MEKLSYELVKLMLKPPLRVIGITAQTVRPAEPHFDEFFNSIDEVYTFFRQKRPVGRWLVWVQASNGQEMPLDSKKWEQAIGGLI